MTKLLWEVEKNNLLENAKRWQEIKLDLVQEELEDIEDHLQKMKYLSELYPSLYIFILKHLNKTNKLHDYFQQCLFCMHDPYSYYLYVHGYLLPFFDELRSEGKL